MDENRSGGLPEEVQREIVDGVVHAVLAWSAGRPAAIERPEGDQLATLMDFVMGEPARGTVDDFVERARAFNPRRDPRLLRYSLLHNLRRLPDGTWTWKYDRRGLSPEGFASVKRSLAELREGARAVTCPVLVVRGADSDAFSDADAARFAAALPDGRWVRVEHAGHTVQGDNPRDLVLALAGFLAEIGHSRSS